MPEQHQIAALEAMGITEEQYHEAIEAERELSERADVKFTVAMLKRSGNPKLPKFAMLYESGLITWSELELAVRTELS